MQLTLKVVLNPRPNEVEFYNILLHSPHDILARGVGNDDAQMEVDKKDLDEAKAEAFFVEKTGVFDKAPPADKIPPIDKAPPQVSEPSIPRANWDKLVASTTEVRANQKEINKKLDLVLQFEKKIDLLLQILNKKEQGKNDNDFATIVSDEFLNPPAYQSTLECTLLKVMIVQ